jgi:hypothetical protein
MPVRDHNGTGWNRMERRDREEPRCEKGAEESRACMTSDVHWPTVLVNAL